MNDKTSVNNLAAEAASLVLRELDEMETRDIFGGDGAWVKVGPVEPLVTSGPEIT